MSGFGSDSLVLNTTHESNRSLVGKPLGSNTPLFGHRSSKVSEVRSYEFHALGPTDEVANSELRGRPKALVQCVFQGASEDFIAIALGG